MFDELQCRNPQNEISATLENEISAIINRQSCCRSVSVNVKPGEFGAAQRGAYLVKASILGHQRIQEVQINGFACHSGQADKLRPITNYARQKALAASSSQ